ncbi:hypothetical protein PV377_48410, partial [Streptomyces ipomoeae]
PAPPVPSQPQNTAPASAEAPRPYVPRRLTPAEAVAPGKLRTKEHLRSLFPRAVRISRMHPAARLIALTLLGHAHFKTGLVSPARRPDMTQLAEETGLTTRQVEVQIHVLTQRGWLYTRPLTQGRHAGEEGLFVAVPALLLEHLRAARSAHAEQTADGGTE